MNRLRANRLCHAYSVMTRTGRRYVGSAPAKQSWTKSSLSVERRDQVCVQRVELRRLHRPVDLAPGDVRLARRLADDELVVRRTAGVLAGAADERPFGGNHAFAASDRLLVQRGRRQIPAARASVRMPSRSSRGAALIPYSL